MREPSAAAETPDFAQAGRAGVHRLYFPAGGHRRKFICVTPEGLAPGQPRPVVFFLHGAGGNAEQSLHTYGWAAKAQAEHFIAVLPEGLGARPDQPGNFVLNPNIWRDGRPGQPFPEIDDAGFFTELLDLMEAVLPVDRSRIYVTGFSNGAAMTFTLGGKLAHRIAAIAPVASQSFSRAAALPRVLPVYYLVNTHDPLVPLEGGKVRLPWGAVVEHEPVQRSLEQWLALNECPPSPRASRERDGVFVAEYGPGPARVVFTRIEGNGHHWPGTVEPLPESISGPRRDPIRATDEIWRFFQEHSLPA
jgi:polyhydroxybutyrate depolymerase